MAPAPIELHLPGPLLGLRLGGPLGPEALAEIVRAARPAEPEADAQLRAQLDAQAQQLRQQVRQAVAALGAGVRKVEQIRGQILAEAEQQLVDLALEVARTLVAQEIAEGRIRIEPIVRKALRRVPSRQEVTVRLHGDDLALCEIAASDGPIDGHEVSFVADACVRRGDCVVETSEGSVELLQDEAFDAVRQAVLGEEG